MLITTGASMGAAVADKLERVYCKRLVSPASASPLLPGFEVYSVF